MSQIWDFSQMRSALDESIEKGERYIDEITLNSKQVILNSSSPEHMAENTIVRFRCMIQDMQTPDIYPDRYYEVDSSTKEKFLRSGRYRNIPLSFSDPQKTRDPSIKFGTARSLFCVPVPGENLWIYQTYQQQSSHNSQDSLPPFTESIPDMYAPCQSKTEKKSAESLFTFPSFFSLYPELRHLVYPNYQVFETSLPFPPEKQNGRENLWPRLTSACVVRAYGDIVENLRVNDIIDVVGIYQSMPNESKASDFVSPFYPSRGSKLFANDFKDDNSEEESTEEDDEEHFVAGPKRKKNKKIEKNRMQRCKADEANDGKENDECNEDDEFVEDGEDGAMMSGDADPSLVPQIHALRIITCSAHPKYTSEWLNIDDEINCSAKRANELVSTRENDSGKMEKDDNDENDETDDSEFEKSPSRHKIARLSHPSALLLERVCHSMKLLHKQMIPFIAQCTAGDINTAEYQHPSTMRLYSGFLQLPSGCAILFDESKIREGSLTSKAIDNIRAIQRVVDEQQADYQFGAGVTSFNTDYRIFFVSVGRSLFKAADVICVLDPSQDMLSGLVREFIAQQHQTSKATTDIYQSSLQTDNLVRAISSQSEEQLQSSLQLPAPINRERWLVDAREAIEVLRSSILRMDKPVMDYIERRLVELRTEENMFHQNDFSLLLALSRVECLSRGESWMSREGFEAIVEREKIRRTRLLQYEAAINEMKQKKWLDENEAAGMSYEAMEEEKEMLQDAMKSEEFEVYREEESEDMEEEDQLKSDSS
ncbi:putative Mini-chromosome maintenance replisome factor [Monocercomonoides exilis]|uniref:putative Mini-chromosome maintenance replisome factor n=1 Tax=Monocercomonoides exilis TaxID=2049356 RepID=UPI003559463E|nr:putative Mini-chromosome maintenance replisome factor [Monocercomonoides exilis]|eukprot:MONOS_3390.1-p1 / transcript=MONOS_3390.1 / gene=MONOS_3390 / organism=Monocercomonoides_exilis_PA203 / gene_product=unspecified product / transcript_product=unspecified product / location=Mono_scaffold00079:114523-117142(+) / protein_length=766 / sequence_SO=supercontig / SO=protein_coding / is_pseudo=false